MNADVAAIVPAAGAGRRVGGRTSKPFVLLNGEPLLVHSLKVLQGNLAIRWIILVVREREHAQAQALIKRHKITKALIPCIGGSSRAESVAKGFKALPREARWVLIHDGARPCVNRQLIQQSVRAAKRRGAVACGLPAMLTIKAVDERREVRLTLDRDHLWFVQTPQVFRRDWFAQALEQACLCRPGRDGRQADHHLEQFPDDAAMMESAGFHVWMIPGDPLNLKVTTREDLLVAEAILRTRTSGQVARWPRKPLSLSEPVP
jgi:2-C-methyl-D-erythritol 4-phosphate cytidylyltransferase